MKILRIGMITLLALLIFVNVEAQRRPAAKKGKGKKEKVEEKLKEKVEEKKEAPPAIKQEESWKHPGGNLLSTSFSSDGKSAVSVNSEGDILFWDIESGKKIRSVHYGSKATAAAFFGNKKVGLAGGLDKDNAISILDLTNGKETQTLAGHKGGVKTLAFSIDGESILSGGWNNQVVLWGTARGDIVRVFKGHDAVVNAVAVSPGRVIAASGSADGKIKVWNMSTGELVKTIKAHKKGVSNVAISPDDRLILSAGIEKGKDKKDAYFLKLWDVATGKLLVKNTNLGEHKAEILIALFSPNGKYALSADRGGALKLWDIAAGSVAPQKGETPPPTEVRSFEGHAGRILTATFSPDGSRVLVGGDGTLTIWETETGKLLGGGAPPASVTTPVEGALPATGTPPGGVVPPPP
ncbi:MAG: WD40 repeat domain-containing protein [Nitrospirae bacterium]|nr:WD40 repeat domain-containing protein [Candidatus Troglogloeales bacterium]